MICTPYFRPVSPVFATPTFNQGPPNPTRQWFPSFPCLASFSLLLSFKHCQRVDRNDSKHVCRSVRVEQQGEEKCLVAARDASIGAVLLQEDAVFTTSAETQTAELAKELAALAADLQDQLLMLCRHNRAASDMREAMEKAAQGCDKTLALLEVFSVNSVGTPKGGSGLYLRCSRCNHSCSPNAYFRLSKDGQHLTLVARRPIMAGVEITISYLPETDLLHPQRHRQDILKNWGFTCHCGRCCHEDLRSFICPSCHGVVQPVGAKNQWACNCRYDYDDEELLQVEEKWQEQLVKARGSRKMVKSCWQDINDPQLLGVDVGLHVLVGLTVDMV